MSDSNASDNGVVFLGSKKQLRKNGRSDYKKAKLWKENAKKRNRLLILAIVVHIITSVAGVLLLNSKSDNLVDNIYFGVMMGFSLSIWFWIAWVLAYKNDQNASKSAVSEWTYLQVVFNQKEMVVCHKTWRDYVGQYLGSIGPVLRGFIPLYRSVVPYTGIQEICFDKNLNYLILKAEGTSAVLKKDGTVVQERSFKEGSRFPYQWIYIPLVFKNNKEFVRELKSRTVIPITESE